MPLSRVAASLLFVLSCLSPIASSATTPDYGQTPPVLLLYRADLLTGKGADYSATEMDIVKAYQAQNIPVYWVALQSMTGTPHYLYFDGYNAFAEIEAAGAVMGKALQANPDLARLQSELLHSIQSTQTILNLRRDDLGYRLDIFDIVKFRYARVTTIQLRSGFEQDFVDTIHGIRKAYEATGSESPWAIFQVHSGMPEPTFFAVQLLNSLKEYDDALEARKRERENPFDFSGAPTPRLPKDAIALLESNIYSVNLRLSHTRGGYSARLASPSSPNNSVYPPVEPGNPIPSPTRNNSSQGRN